MASNKSCTKLVSCVTGGVIMLLPAKVPSLVVGATTLHGLRAGTCAAVHAASPVLYSVAEINHSARLAYTGDDMLIIVEHRPPSSA